MTDFISCLCGIQHNIIPERERDAFIMTVFDDWRIVVLAKSISEALTGDNNRNRSLKHLQTFSPRYSHFDPFFHQTFGKVKVFGALSMRQQQVNLKYARFLEAIEKKPESCG